MTMPGRCLRHRRAVCAPGCHPPVPEGAPWM